MSYEVTCEIHDMESGDEVAMATSENDASPNVARNSALMKVINDDDVNWEAEGGFEVDCYTG